VDYRQKRKHVLQSNATSLGWDNQRAQSAMRIRFQPTRNRAPIRLTERELTSREAQESAEKKDILDQDTALYLGPGDFEGFIKAASSDGLLHPLEVMALFKLSLAHNERVPSEDLERIQALRLELLTDRRLPISAALVDALAYAEAGFKLTPQHVAPLLELADMGLVEVLRDLRVIYSDRLSPEARHRIDAALAENVTPAPTRGWIEHLLNLSSLRNEIGAMAVFEVVRDLELSWPGPSGHLEPLFEALEGKQLSPSGKAAQALLKEAVSQHRVSDASVEAMFEAIRHENPEMRNNTMGNMLPTFVGHMLSPEKRAAFREEGISLEARVVEEGLALAARDGLIGPAKALSLLVSYRRSGGSFETLALFYRENAELFTPTAEAAFRLGMKALDRPLTAADLTELFVAVGRDRRARTPDLAYALKEFRDAFKDRLSADARDALEVIITQVEDDPGLPGADGQIVPE
jgi:hypothetical protein